jgi:hypothetical protein
MNNLIDALEAQYARYLSLEPGTALVLAVWSLGTHLHQSFSTYGYLGITSPELGCGKSLVMEVMELFCASPDYTVNSSGPALFRTIHKDSPTLLIDEAEKLSPDLRAIINTGYRRRAAVPRCLGPEVVRFRTYCPKVLASLNMLSPALLDRVILIQMRKALPDEGLTRFDFESAQQQVADLHADMRASGGMRRLA